MVVRPTSFMGEYLIMLNKMKQAVYILMSFFSFMLFSCKKDFGMIISETRTAGPVKKIILDHKIDLVLTQSTIETIKVSAGEKTIANVQTELKDSILIIQYKKNSTINDPGNPIEVQVSVADLQMIEYKGSGYITSTNTLLPSSFTIVSSRGAGIVDLKVETGHLVAGIYEENADFIISGKAASAYVYCSSRGTMDLKNMEVKNMSLVYSSVRNGYVWATQTLTGTIYHTGNIFYKGSPVLNNEEKSSGRFLPF
jgi:hypothetical protein